MRKNQKTALLLLKKLGTCNELDFLARGIPMSAVDALIRKGLVTRPERLAQEFILTDAGRTA